MSFETQAITEGKKPDFIFPSGAAYRDPYYPAEQLRMLGLKPPVRTAGGRY